MFKFTDLREQRKNRFNQHPVVPRAARANLQVFQLIDFAPKAGICKNNHLVGDSFNQRQKFRVGNIYRFNAPIDNQSELICQQTEFAADNPSPTGKPLSAEPVAMRLMNLANRMTQLNAVRINNAEEGRLGKKCFGQLPMRLQAAEKPGALGQMREKRLPILSHPAIESPPGNSFESEQQAKRHEFADGKFDLFMLWRFRQHIIYTAPRQAND